MTNQPIARNYSEVQHRLASRLPFRHSTMSAEFIERPFQLPNYHRLNSEDFADLRTCVETAQAVNGAVYVVSSYNTPIAWVDIHNTIHTTEQKFSATTSKHQSYVRTTLK